MKYSTYQSFLLSATLLTAGACSMGRNKNPRALESPGLDVLAKESLGRYTPAFRSELKVAGIDPFKGLIRCYEGELNQGLKELSKSLSAARENPDYWNSIGTCYYLNKDWDKAEYFYQLSINTAQKKNKDYPAGKNNLGLVYLNLGHKEEALDLFEDAAKSGALTPSFNLGLLRSEFGQTARAAAILNKLYQTNSGDPDVITALGVTMLEAGEVEKALTLFKKLPENTARRPEVAMPMAHAYFILGRLEDSQATLERSLTTTNRKLFEYRQELTARIQASVDKLNAAPEKPEKPERGQQAVIENPKAKKKSL